MSSPAIIDFEALLAPIAGPSPSGAWLLNTAAYDAIREARRFDDPDLSQGQWKRDLKTANWRDVIKISAEALKAKTKDVQIAVWLIDALIRQSGFAGLRDGLRLLRELHERYWDTFYPPIEDGDLEFRVAPVDWLNDKVPPSIRAIGLTKADGGAEPYSWLHWQESRAIDDLGRKDAKAKTAAIAEGKIAGEQFDKAVATTPTQFYHALREELVECDTECTNVAIVIDERFGKNAPSLLEVKKAIYDCSTLVEEIVRKKTEVTSAVGVPSNTTSGLPAVTATAQVSAAKKTAQPAPVATSSAQPESGGAAKASAESGAALEPQASRLDQAQPALQAVSSAVANPVGGESPTNGKAPAASAQAPTVASAAPVNPSGSLGLEPRDRTDALQRLQAIAAFFRRTEPHSPVAYLVQRAARWGEMPLEQWLTDVITDKNVLAHLRETLGLKA